MSKIIFSKVMWVGRATGFLVGLAVMLALALGNRHRSHQCQRTVLDTG